MKTVLSLTVTLLPLVFGLAAWTLGLIRILSRKHRSLLATFSWFCCAASLWFPLQAIYRWVQNEDIAAILDCVGAYFLCATVLLLVNFLLFGIGLLVKKKP